MATPSLHHRLNLLVVVLLAVPAVAQTQLDLRTQSRNVDFSGAISTRPIKTGFNLPGACSVGDLFFRSSSTAGRNLFGCTSLNTWTVQADVMAPAGMSNYSTSFTNQTALSITAAMHGFDSPNLLVSCYDGATPSNVFAPAGVTINSNTLEVTITFAGPRSGRCVLNAPGTAYVNGVGLVQNGAEFSVDVATVPSFLRSHADLAAWSIPAQSCLDRLFTLEGAALLDTVIPGWPADLDPSLNGTMLVSTAGTVTIRLCNISSASAVSVPPRTFGVAILKTF